jgi:hypothetical protein
MWLQDKFLAFQQKWFDGEDSKNAVPLQKKR